MVDSQGKCTLNASSVRVVSPERRRGGSMIKVAQFNMSVTLRGEMHVREVCL